MRQGLYYVFEKVCVSSVETVEGRLCERGTYERVACERLACEKVVCVCEEVVRGTVYDDQTVMRQNRHKYLPSNICALENVNDVSLLACFTTRYVHLIVQHVALTCSVLTC